MQKVVLATLSCLAALILSTVVVVIGCGKSHSARSVPEGLDVDELNPGDSTDLYRGDKVKLTVRTKDGGAYLYLAGLHGDIDLDVPQAKALWSEIVKFDDFRAKYKDAANVEVESFTGSCIVQLTKNQTTGFSVTIHAPATQTSVILPREDVDGILPHLRNAEAILANARK